MTTRRGFLGTLAAAVVAVTLEVLPSVAPLSAEEIPIEIQGYFCIADLLASIDASGEQSRIVAAIGAA